MVHKEEQFNTKRQAIAGVKYRIFETVSRNYISHIVGSKSARQMITTLEEAVEYTLVYIEYLLERITLV